MKLIIRAFLACIWSTRYIGPAVLALFMLAVRIIWGYAFFVTGKGKLENIDRVTGFFAGLHIPAPHANAIFIGSLECFGGLLLLIGLVSRPIAFLMVGNMIVAYLTTEMDSIKTLFTDGKPQDFINADPFYFLAASVLILALGPRILSIDALIAWLLKRYFPRKPDLAEFPVTLSGQPPLSAPARP